MPLFDGSYFIFLIVLFLPTDHFLFFFNKGWGKRWITSTTTSKPAKILPVNIYLLPHLFDQTPKESEQLIHMQAGLGRKQSI